jgi:hypothetical protein
MRNSEVEPWVWLATFVFAAVVGLGFSAVAML